MNKTLFVASVLALAGLSSVAAAADNSWFVRGDVGSSNLSLNGFSGSSSQTSGGLGGGYYFTPNFAVEGFYNDLGTRNDGIGDSVKLDGWGVGLVLKKDFGPNNTGFFVDGRGGAFFNQTKVNVAGIGSTSDNSTKPYLGAGLGYDFNPTLGLSVNYDYTKFNAFGLSGHAGSVNGALEIRF
jgi:outer membrane protein W